MDTVSPTSYFCVKFLRNRHDTKISRHGTSKNVGT